MKLSMSNDNFQPKTRKGQATKTKMIEAAAELIHQNGIHSTTVNDVLAKSKTGKSQFSHYFGSKETLIHDVIDYHYEKRVLPQIEALQQVQSLEDFQPVIDYYNQRQGEFIDLKLGRLTRQATHLYIAT
jgi:TetR/AcrR family transcriptional repressor of nem operon